MVVFTGEGCSSLAWAPFRPPPQALYLCPYVCMYITHIWILIRRDISSSKSQRCLKQGNQQVFRVGRTLLVLFFFAFLLSIKCYSFLLFGPFLTHTCSSPFPSRPALSHFCRCSFLPPSKRKWCKVVLWLLSVQLSVVIISHSQPDT